MTSTVARPLLANFLRDAPQVGAPRAFTPIIRDHFSMTRFGRQLARFEKIFGSASRMYDWTCIKFWRVGLVSRTKFEQNRNSDDGPMGGFGNSRTRPFEPPMPEPMAF